MRLPVEQYYELDPELIVPLHGNHFALMVPRVHVRRCAAAMLLPLAMHAHALRARRCDLPSFSSGTSGLQGLRISALSVQLLGVWLEPRVEVEVRLTAARDCVIITVQNPSPAPMMFSCRQPRMPRTLSPFLQAPMMSLPAGSCHAQNTPCR